MLVSNKIHPVNRFHFKATLPAWKIKDIFHRGSMYFNWNSRMNLLYIKGTTEKMVNMSPTRSYYGIAIIRLRAWRLKQGIETINCIDSWCGMCVPLACINQISKSHWTILLKLKNTYHLVNSSKFYDYPEPIVNSWHIVGFSHTKDLYISYAS